MYAGIEAGGTKFVVAVGTSPEDLSERVTFPTTTPDETLQAAIDAIGRLAVGRTLEAVGIASFGPVDLNRESPTYGSITSTPKPGWQGTDLVGRIGEALGLLVGFDTDVNGAALGEALWGAARGLGTAVYITVGTGIGGGGVIGAELLHGLIHPEMGHLLVRRHPRDDYPGLCPFHGDCLEGLATGPAMQARWRRSPKALGALLEAAVDIEAWYLAQLVTSIAYILSPERIILGGGVLHVPGLLDATRAQALALLNGYLDHPVIVEKIDEYVVHPGLGDNAGVLGAIALAERAAREGG